MRFLLCFLAWSGVLVAAQQTTKQETVAPEAARPKKADSLPAGVRETLLRATEIELRLPPQLPPEKAEADRALEAATAGFRKQLEELERALSASSVVKTPEVSRLLMRLLDAREPTVRLTALHWLAARLDVQETALLKGLQDPNGDMQTVAIQILAIRGVQGPAAKELRQALAANDQATLRRLVRSVTPKPAPGR